MSLVIGMEGLNRFLPILGAISHANGAPLQFLLLGGKGMRLEIMNHLKFVFDITLKQIGSSQRIGRFIAAVVSRERLPRAMHPRAKGQRTLRGSCDCACGVDRSAGPAQQDRARCRMER